MPRTEIANQKVRAAQRAKILDAARRVFARRGMAATMTDVSTEAGVSQGLAYRYFASKEAIFAELVEQTTQTSLAFLQYIQDLPNTPGQRLNSLISMIFSYSPQRLEYYQLLLRMLNDETTPDHLYNLLLGQIQSFQQLLRQLIVEGQITREVAEGDPDQLVIVILACFNGLSGLVVHSAEHTKHHFPDPKIILRLLQP
ncbi:MAG: TetR/AcrR family transcriptional regulator [Chloroflexota bacterium]